MRTRWLILTLALVGCTACASGSPKDSEQLTEQPVEPPGEGFLVYYAQDEGVETAWLEVDGSDWEVLARSQGAYAAAGGHLWHWASREVEHELSDCQCIADQYNQGNASDEDLAKCQTSGTTETPVLENSSGGDDVPLVEISDMEQTGDVSVGATNHGTVGKYWFGTACTYIYACGAAHGSVNCESVVTDLESGEVMELNEFMSGDEFASVGERLRERAVEQLGEKTPDNTQITEAESAQLEAGWPVLTRDGLVFDYLFAAPTCYACSDGSWSSYSVGTEVRDAGLPARLESLANPPAAVLGFIESQNSFGDITGWTALPNDGERRAAFLDQFRASEQIPNGGMDD